MKNLIILTLVVMPLGAGLLTTCARATKQEKDLVVMVISKRLLLNAMEKWPAQFSPLLKASRLACDASADKEQAIEDAFTTILRVVTRDLKDQTLKDDLWLLTQIMGLEFDVNFNIFTTTPGARNYLEMIICNFAQGDKRGGDI